MKQFFLICLLLVTLQSFAQVVPVSADPALGGASVRNASTNSSLNANQLVQAQTIKFRLPVFNLSTTDPIPPGTCIIQIGLGTNMILDPSFTAPLSAYFTWTSLPPNPPTQLQTLVIGTLVNALPPSFAGNADFLVQGSVLGSSSFTSNFSISNDNPDFTLSDNNPSNNSSSLSYTIATAASTLPVSFTRVSAAKKGCDITVNWAIENQLDLKNYEVEISKNGIQFAKIAEAAAGNLSQYSATFTINDQIAAPSIFIRIKSVDLDGKFKYSKIVSVSGLCQDKESWQPFLFPNPVVSYTNSLTISTKQGLFNGSFKLTLVDNSGRVCQVDEVQLSNATSFPFKFKALLPAGKYMIQVKNNDGSQARILPFEKL